MDPLDLEILGKIASHREVGIGFEELWNELGRPNRNSLRKRLNNLISSGYIIEQPHPRDRRRKIFKPSSGKMQEIKEILFKEFRRVVMSYAKTYISSLKGELIDVTELLAGRKEKEDKNALYYLVKLKADGRETFAILRVSISETFYTDILSGKDNLSSLLEGVRTSQQALKRLKEFLRKHKGDGFTLIASEPLSLPLYNGTSSHITVPPNDLEEWFREHEEEFVEALNAFIVQGTNPETFLSFLTDIRNSFNEAKRRGYAGTFLMRHLDTELRSLLIAVFYQEEKFRPGGVMCMYGRNDFPSLLLVNVKREITSDRTLRDILLDLTSRTVHLIQWVSEDEGRRKGSLINVYLNPESTRMLTTLLEEKVAENVSELVEKAIRSLYMQHKQSLT